MGTLCHLTMYQIRSAHHLFTRWLVALFWTTLMLILLVSPGTSPIVTQISLFFGGTEASDAIGHVILYGILAALWYRVLSSYLKPQRALLLVVCCTLFAGTISEILQRLVPDRGASLLDLIANWLGVLITAALLRYWFRHRRLTRGPITFDQSHIS